MRAEPSVARQLQPDVSPAAWAVGGVSLSLVGAGDRVDYRQAETGATAPVAGVDPAEALEGPAKEVVGEAGPVIDDVKLHVTVPPHRRQAHIPSP